MGKYLVMQHLCDVEIKRLRADSLKYYADSASLCLEHMYFDALKQKSDYYCENIRKEKENEQMRIHSERNKWLYTILTVVLVFLAVYIISRLKYHNKIEREKQLREINDERSRNKILQMEKEAKEKEIEITQSELSHREKLLHQKSISLSLMQKYFMSKLTSISKEKFGSDQIQITDEVWDEIERLLNYADNNFVVRLREQYPKMRKEDVQLCMLVRMKFTNLTIGKVFNIQKSAVQKRKNNLKKNIFQISNPDKYLEIIIEQI